MAQRALLTAAACAAAAAGDCPGGSLSACMDLCPSSPASAYKECVDRCVAGCSGPTPPAPPPPAPATPAPAPPAPGASPCAAYVQDPATAKCNASCGDCFNPGARKGVLCQGGSVSATGYLCPPEAQGGEMAFACLDWSFGSAAMRRAEAAFTARAGQDVFFGIGTFGTDADPQKGLGSCYRLQVQGMAKELIVQSINTGSDVSGNQFDMQVGDGGAGIFNACAGGSAPGKDTMFPGPYSEDTWGKQYGGVDNRVQCAGLPPLPEQDAPMKTAGDDLISLCQYSFDHGARGEGGENPSILSIGRVQCPAELAEMTQIQRVDDPAGYTPASPAKAAHACQASVPNMPLDWCLTRMMDCRKPSGAWRSNVHPELMAAGKRLVQTCTADGYTRIDNQCGCMNCWC